MKQLIVTESVPKGVTISKAAGGNMVPCVQELGGKSAAIVIVDTDLDAFETDIRRGVPFYAGQVCSAMVRVILHESRHVALLNRAVGMVAATQGQTA